MRRHPGTEATSSIAAQWSPCSRNAALSRGLGLPDWVNHLAFAARDLDALDAARDRGLAHGHDVLRINHGWTVSVYTNDPDGNLVEWCCTVKPFTEVDAVNAAWLVADPAPACEPLPEDIEFFLAAEFATTG